MLEPIQQGELIDKDGPQGEPLCVDQALGRHLVVAIEDAFELLIEVLDGCGAQLVEDATHFFPNIGMGIRPILRDDQEAVRGLPGLADVGRIVVNVTQQIADGCWQFLNEGWGHLIVRLVGRGEGSRRGNPHCGYGCHDM